MSDTNARPPSAEEIAAMFARMAPPSTPRDAIETHPAIAKWLQAIDGRYAATLLAGLATDASLQANAGRLDWATRLALAYGDGKQRPSTDELSEFLNSGMVQARITLLEDPPEDFFVDALLTQRGEFLLFAGLSEKASFMTEATLVAFWALPDGPPKSAAEASVYALLSLSTALAQRAAYDWRTVGNGVAQGEIALPTAHQLNALANRVTFTWEELKSLGISVATLAPFLLRTAEIGSLSAAAPGNSIVEHRPLFATATGLVVAFPQNISTAARSLLINTAVEHDFGDRLKLNFIGAHAGWLRQASFPAGSMKKIHRAGDSAYREYVHELLPGRYLHVFHSMDGFAGWPDRAFGSVSPVDPKLQTAFLSSIKEKAETLKGTRGFKSGFTIWLAGGWGSGHSLAIDQPFPDDWGLILLDPSDILTFSALDDAKPADLWRLDKLQSLVSAQGFEMSNASGFLNLYRWWQQTDHSLVPPNALDCQPPMVIDFGTDLLLASRVEAAQKLGRRSFRHPTGQWHLASKVERGAMASAFPNVYGSLNAAMTGRLLGVIETGCAQWWIEVTGTEQTSTSETYETWRAVLFWGARILPAFAEAFQLPEGDFQFNIELQTTNEGRTPVASLSDAEIEAAIATKVTPDERRAELTLMPKWQQGFFRPDNYAEAALAVAILRGASELLRLSVPDEQLWAIVRKTTGSTDFRHRHAFETDSVSDRLVAHGLIDAFRAVPASAAAIVKCGSVWPVHPREEGPFVQGKERCIELVTRFCEFHTDALIADVSTFGRKSLILEALKGIQAAVADENHWARSARALRAIHGHEGDFAQSLKSSTQNYAVIRANSILIELAAAARSETSDRSPDAMDLEDLQARALMIFQSADTLPPIYADRSAASFEISPTGDILFDHEFEQSTIVDSAKLRHARERERASDRYLERFLSAKTNAPPANTSLEQAVEIEYGTDSLHVVDLPYALAQICQQEKAAVLALRRSDLLTRIRSVSYMSEMNERLIDRLTLPIRNGWHDIPPGCTKSDFDFSRFDRRFSPIGRPIIALNADNDPLLAVAPVVVDRALHHNLNGAFRGLLQNDFWQTTAMRAFASKRGSIEGLQFNIELADELKAKGIEAYPSAAPSWCLNIKRTEQVARLGDIDVLAISDDRKRVWVLEAKDLKLCRTQGEAARRLSAYRGVEKRNGKPDDLLRHLQRVKYLRENADKLVQRLKLPCTPTIHGAVVVNSPQPMHQLQGAYVSDSTVVQLSNIGTIPWSEGW